VSPIRRVVATSPDPEGSESSAGTTQSRVVGRVLRIGVVVLLVGAIVLLSWAGHTKNRQISELKTQGQTHQGVVVSCLGELGGSGSNPAGYSCQGTYRVNGVRYQVTLPGTSFRAPGSRFVAVVAPSDPTVMSTPAVLAGEEASNAVYRLPAALLVVLLVGVAGDRLLRRRTMSPS